MEILYFTLVAAVLYLAADWIVRGIEMMRGGVLPYRSIVFFGILLTLALSTFALLRRILGG